VGALRRSLRLVAKDGRVRYDRRWVCRRGRSFGAAGRGATFDDGRTDALFHDSLLLLFFDMALDALDDFRWHGTHVISDVGHADGLQQSDERLVV
jgi:hypothetical protein